MLQMLVQHLQLLYHNHQQQVDMENYMNYYMLLNPPRGINRRVAMATLLRAAPGSSSLLLVYFVAEVTAPLTVPAYVLQRVQRFRAVSCGSTAPLTVPFEQTR